MIWRYSSSATVAWSCVIALHPNYDAPVAMKLDSGTRVVVTGASRGIGAAVADAFQARGCEVGRVARSGAISANVGDLESIERALEGFGPVDVLVANAGVAHYLPFTEMPRETVDALTQVNWLGTAYSVKAALPGM